MSYLVLPGVLYSTPSIMPPNEISAVKSYKTLMPANFVWMLQKIHVQSYCLVLVLNKVASRNKALTYDIL